MFIFLEALENNWQHTDRSQRQHNCEAVFQPDWLCQAKERDTGSIDKHTWHLELYVLLLQKTLLLGTYFLGALLSPPKRIFSRSIFVLLIISEFFSFAFLSFLEVPSVARWSIKYIIYDFHIFISFPAHSNRSLEYLPVTI